MAKRLWVVRYGFLLFASLLYVSEKHYTMQGIHVPLSTAIVAVIVAVLSLPWLVGFRRHPTRDDWRAVKWDSLWYWCGLNVVAYRVEHLAVPWVALSAVLFMVLSPPFFRKVRPQGNSA